jgi:hypothetical protein
MKMHKKPLIALVSGPILLAGLLCQTAHAATVMVETNTAVLADILGANTGPEALTVGYSVTKDTISDIYTYTYTVNNPAGDVILGGADAGQPEILDLFSVDFNASVLGAVLGTPTGGTFGENNGIFGISWFLLTPNVAAGANSGPLSFESLDAPIMGDASASDANPPSPWDSSPDGNPVPVPFVPDSTSTMPLLAGMMLLLPFGSVLKKKAGF